MLKQYGTENTSFFKLRIFGSLVEKNLTTTLFSGLGTFKQMCIKDFGYYCLQFFSIYNKIKHL